MTIEITDNFLINSGGSSYKVGAFDLQDASGVVLVNRNGSSYKCSVADLEDNLQTTDVLVVDRVGTNYQVTGQEVLDVLTPPSVLVTGLTWNTLSAYYQAGSSFAREETFYNGDPNVGVDLGYNNRPYPVKIEAKFYNQISQGIYWKVTKIIYGEWTRFISDRIGPGRDSSGISITIDYQPIVGDSNRQTAIFELKEPADILSLGELVIPPKEDYKYVTQIDLIGGEWGYGYTGLAAGNYEIWGYRVDENGKPIRD